MIKKLKMNEETDMNKFYAHTTLHCYITNLKLQAIISVRGAIYVFNRSIPLLYSPYPYMSWKNHINEVKLRFFTSCPNNLSIQLTKVTSLRNLEFENWNILYVSYSKISN